MDSCRRTAAAPDCSLPRRPASASARSSGPREIARSARISQTAQNAIKPDRSNWTGVAFGLTLASFAAYQQFKLPPALPVLLDAYHYDRTLAGAFMSVYAVAGLLLSMAFGRLLAHRGSLAPTLGALGLSVPFHVCHQQWLYADARKNRQM